jgi:hypothetical protein
MVMNSPRRVCASILLASMLPVPAVAAKAPKLPDDAPYCAAAGARQSFLSPMGEPFHAPAGQPYPAAAWVSGADANKDGALDRREMLDDARRFFATLDTDHDGRLSPEEVTAYERDVAPEIALYRTRQPMMPPPPPAAGEPGARPSAHPGGDELLGVVPPRRVRDGESGYGGPMGAGRFAWLNIPEPVAAIDADFDRLVSRDEFVAAAGRRFDTLTQARGALKLAELPKTPAQMSAEGPCVPRPTPRQQLRENERRDGVPRRRFDLEGQ